MIVLYSILFDKKVAIINVHAECALHEHASSFFEPQEKSEARKMYGMYCRTANAAVLQEIYDQEYVSFNLCLDFDGITELAENNCNTLCSFVNNSFCARNRTVYFINLCYDLKVMLDKNFAGKCDLQKAGDVWYGIAGEQIEYSCESLMKLEDDLFYEQLEEMVKNATVCQAEEIKHASVPVHLSKYINVKKMLETDPRFFRFSIYKLAVSMMRKGLMSEKKWDNKNPNFFFQTINGSYIAVQLARLFNTHMVYMDHLGPMEMVYRKHFEKSIRDGGDYIIIADVICLGGEVGRAKTIIEYCGGRVAGEVCIVDIQTLKDTGTENRVSLYTVSKENNKIGYTISTDL